MAPLFFLPLLLPSFRCMNLYLCTLLTSIFFILSFLFLFHSQLITFIFFLSPFFLFRHCYVYYFISSFSAYIIFPRIPAFSLVYQFFYFLYFLFNLTTCCLIYISSVLRTYLSLLVIFPLGLLRRARHSEYCLTAFGYTSLLYSNTLPWQQHAEDFRSYRNPQVPGWNFCKWHT
jgi:hypothetical protein